MVTKELLRVKTIKLKKGMANRAGEAVIARRRFGVERWTGD